MRVKSLLPDENRIYAKLAKESYFVIVYGEYDQNSKIFIIANDDLELIEPSDEVVEIIDFDLTDYTGQETKYNLTKLLISNIFLKHSIKTKHYGDIKSADIWTRSKLSNFFVENNFLIPQSYKDKVLSVNYKLNLIEGFLMFAELYINNKNKSDSYSDSIYFYVSDSYDKIIEERFKDDMKVDIIDLSKYESELYNFISKYLYDEKENEEKSIAICTQLFKLIDSIFINKISNIFHIDTFYDEVLVIEYENKFYCLSKTWVS